MKRNAVKGGTLAVAVAAAIVVGVFCLYRGAGAEAAYPAERFKRIFSTRVMSRIRGLWMGGEAEAENVRLRREVASLAMLQGDCARLEEENARLRRALDYVNAGQGRWIAAAVLSDGGAAAAARRTLRVGKGSLAGVEKGDVVAVPEGLVGRVTAVTPHTAEVLLIVDPALKVSCIIEGERGAKGILSGGTDELLVMRHFSFPGSVLSAHATSVAMPGARVFTSGLGGVFPSGIAVGTLVGDSSRGDGSLPRECEVRPFVDFESLEDVFIRKE